MALTSIEWESLQAQREKHLRASSFSCILCNTQTQKQFLIQWFGSARDFTFIQIERQKSENSSHAILVNKQKMFYPCNTWDLSSHRAVRSCQADQLRGYSLTDSQRTRTASSLRPLSLNTIPHLKIKI